MFWSQLLTLTQYHKRAKIIKTLKPKIIVNITKSNCTITPITSLIKNLDNNPFLFNITSQSEKQKGTLKMIFNVLLAYPINFKQ